MQAVVRTLDLHDQSGTIGLPSCISSHHSELPGISYLSPFSLFPFLSVFVGQKIRQLIKSLQQQAPHWSGNWAEPDPLDDFVADPWCRKLRVTPG